MLRYGAMIMVAGLFGAINETLDRNLLPRLWPSGQAYQGQSYTGLALNGIYAANYKLGMFIALVTQAFRYAAEPLFFKQADQQSAPRLFARALYVYVLGGLAMFVLIASFSFEIVSFNFWGLSRWHLVPPDYWVGLEVVPLILLANLFLGVYTQLSIWFKLTDQLSYGLLISAFGALITLTVNLLLIPTYGYMAAALATLLCYVSMVVLCYFVGQVFYPVPYRWGRLLTYAGLACGLVWLHLALPDWGLGWLKWLTAPSALALMAWAEGLRPHHLRRLRR
jgi:O-antigen/teichoic acid export membrane protein